MKESHEIKIGRDGEGPCSHCGFPLYGGDTALVDDAGLYCSRACMSTIKKTDEAAPTDADGFERCRDCDRRTCLDCGARVYHDGHRECDARCMHVDGREGAGEVEVTP